MMTNLMKTKAIFGIIFLSLVVCSSYLKVGEGRAQVSFTYTAQIPQKTVEVSDSTTFFSTLRNTGSGSDTYDVDMIEKPPTPAVWWMRFCAGGVCVDSLVTHAHSTLGSGEYDNITLDILPRTLGTGKVTMRITSQTNPSVKDSITFTLYSVTKVPVLNRWGLVIFIILISSSGFYLVLRRLKLSKSN